MVIFVFHVAVECMMHHSGTQGESPPSDTGTLHSSQDAYSHRYKVQQMVQDMHTVLCIPSVVVSATALSLLVV